MILLADPRTYWLNLTNIALGIATLVLVLLMARAALKDYAENRRQ